jgi:hypothetical protein
VIFDAIDEASALFNADEVVETTLRDTVKHGNFDEVDEMIERDKQLRRKRRYPSIMENLGINHFKIDKLNYRAYVLKQEGHEAMYLIGNSKLPTPILSAATSVKPSVTKNEINNSGLINDSSRSENILNQT